MFDQKSALRNKGLNPQIQGLRKGEGGKEKGRGRKKERKDMFMCCREAVPYSECLQSPEKRVHCNIYYS